MKNVFNKFFPEKVGARLIICMLLSALAGFSCMSDTTEPGPGERPVSDRKVNFSIRVPASPVAPQSRSITDTEENYITSLYIFSFKIEGNSEKFDYWSEAKEKAGNINGSPFQSYSATLKVGNHQQRLVLLANTGDEVKQYIEQGNWVGVEKETMLAGLEEHLMSAGDRWNANSPSDYRALPMWGESTPQTIINTTADLTGTIPLLRMVASVNVQLDETVDGLMDKFRLTSVRLYNTNTKGSVVPAKGNYEVITNGNRSVRVYSPTIPADIEDYSQRHLGPLLYEDFSPPGQPDIAMLNAIYLFEAASTTQYLEATCLVVGGFYADDNLETYYRVNFVSDDGQTLLNILRNHKYIVNIVDVRQSGHKDPDEAFHSKGEDMEISILQWDETDMGEIVFDGEFYLSVSKDNFTFGQREIRAKEQHNILYVKTDYIFMNDPTSPQSGWYVEKYVDADDDTTPVDWLKLVPETGTPHTKIEAYIEVDENTGVSSRDAIVWIAAGRLRYPVYVRQGVISIDITDQDDNNNPISEMIFAIPFTENREHSPRHFEVSWTPVGEAVTLSKKSPQDWNEFDPSWANPVLTGTIPGGTGSESYEVRPPAVTDQELGTDPFYQKETTFNFMVGLTNGETETKGITLRQIYYNLLVDTYTYRLDGKTYNINVRSNADWEITKIEEWLHDIDPAINNPSSPVFLQLRDSDDMRIGTTGGPNVNGENVSFTVINRLDNSYQNRWGTIYVTFESPDNKFAPQRIPIKFTYNNSDRVSIIGFGYGIDATRAFAMTPYNSHDNTAYRMMRAQRNFGDLPESVVNVKALDLMGYHMEGVLTTPKQQEFIRAMESNPDIIVISYSFLLNQDQCDIIANFVNSGGVAIMFVGGYHDNVGTYWEHAPYFAGARRFLRTIFEDQTIETTGYPTVSTGVGDTYKFPEGDQWADNPVLNGPFGDLRGKHWGAHMNSIGFKGSPETMNQIDVFNWSEDNLSRNTSGHVVGFIHKTKNLIWIGADCFMTGRPRSTVAETYTDPFMLDDDFSPVPRIGWWSTGMPPSPVDVYNSQAMANIMAWAISRVEDN